MFSWMERMPAFLKHTPLPTWKSHKDSHVLMKFMFIVKKQFAFIAMKKSSNSKENTLVSHYTICPN